LLELRARRFAARSKQRGINMLCLNYLTILVTTGALLALSGCSARDTQAQHLESAIQPVATLQELMQAEVDASADSIWDAVETTTTQSGVEEKQPRTAEEWQEVRRKAIVLIEAANLLAVDGRRIAAAPFPAEAAGALDSAEIEQQIAGNRVSFNQYAVTLRETARTMLAAIDAKDPKALVTAGGVLDEVCESCHLAFWYPKQIIPPYPKEGDPRLRKVLTNPTARQASEHR
jgi:hypothetical protein